MLLNGLKKEFTIQKKRNARVFASKAKWETIGGKTHYFRSKLERNFALCLEHSKSIGLIVDWQYEPRTFWFESIMRGQRSYKPDFLVYNRDTTHGWYETKGYMDSCSRTKLKRFLKYYPEEPLYLVKNINTPILLTKSNVKEILKDKYGKQEEKDL